MLTDFQIKKLTLLFNFWDYDNSGALRQNDYEAVGRRMAAEREWRPDSLEYQVLQQRLMADWAQLQEFADLNNDDTVTLPEWLAFCDYLLDNEAMYEATVTAMASAIIDAVDRDGDGALQVEEWATIYRVYGWRDAMVAAQTFATIDTDGDRSVSKDELLKALDEFFQSNDENAPGNYVFGPLDP